MNKKTISLIKKVLRRGSLKHAPRNEARSIAKIDSALFKCQCGGCDTAMYEGSSDSNFEDLVKKHPELRLVREKGHVDHINPVREGKGELDWTDYINSLYCELDNLQYLSPECHDTKSKKDRTNGSC